MTRVTKQYMILNSLFTFAIDSFQNGSFGLKNGTKCLGVKPPLFPVIVVSQIWEFVCHMNFLFCSLQVVSLVSGHAKSWRVSADEVEIIGSAKSRLPHRYISILGSTIHHWQWCEEQRGAWQEIIMCTNAKQVLVKRSKENPLCYAPA